MLAAAEALIRREGPNVTMADLARASAVTKPSLYRCVGDRNALVASLAERFSDRVNLAVAAAIDTGGAAREQVYQMLRAYLGVVEEDGNVFLFIATDADVADRIDHVLHIADISAIPIARTLAWLGAPADAVETWSYAFVGAAQFATFRWLRDRSESADQIAEHLTSLLWTGIGGRRTP